MSGNTGKAGKHSQKEEEEKGNPVEASPIVVDSHMRYAPLVVSSTTATPSGRSVAPGSAEAHSGHSGRQNHATSTDKIVASSPSSARDQRLEGPPRGPRSIQVLPRPPQLLVSEIQTRLRPQGGSTGPSSIPQQSAHASKPPQTAAPKVSGAIITASRVIIPPELYKSPLLKMWEEADMDNFLEYNSQTPERDINRAFKHPSMLNLTRDNGLWMKFHEQKGTAKNKWAKIPNGKLFQEWLTGTDGRVCLKKLQDEITGERSELQKRETEAKAKIEEERQRTEGSVGTAGPAQMKRVTTNQSKTSDTHKASGDLEWNYLDKNDLGKGKGRAERRT